MNIIAQMTEFLRNRRVHANNLVSDFTSCVIALALFADPLPFFVSHRSDAAYGTLASLLTLSTGSINREFTRCSRRRNAFNTMNSTNSSGSSDSSGTSGSWRAPRMRGTIGKYGPITQKSG